jgi:hypothetical protein
MSTPITKHFFIPIVTYPLIVGDTSGKATGYPFRIFSRLYNGIRGMKVWSGSMKYVVCDWQGLLWEMPSIATSSQNYHMSSYLSVSYVQQRAVVLYPAIQASFIYSLTTVIGGITCPVALPLDTTLAFSACSGAAKWTLFASFCEHQLWAVQ